MFMPRRSRGGVSTTGGMGSSSNIQDINEDNQSPTKLYLGNLPRTVTKIDIEKHFRVNSGKGSISTKIKLMNGFGFLEFEDPDDASAIVSEFNGLPFKGQTLLVQSLPRRVSKQAKTNTEKAAEDQEGEPRLSLMSSWVDELKQERETLASDKNIGPIATTTSGERHGKYQERPDSLKQGSQPINPTISKDKTREDVRQQAMLAEFGQKSKKKLLSLSFG